MVNTYQNGDYRIEGQAASRTSNVSASDAAELTIQNEPQLSHKIGSTHISGGRVSQGHILQGLVAESARIYGIQRPD